MRYIRTTNNIAEFIETNDQTGQIISSMGFQFGEVYYLIKNKKVTFYLNDSEKPFDNFIWSLDIPFMMDDVLYEDEDTASAHLYNVFNDRFQEQLDELREDLEEEIGRSIATDEALSGAIETEREERMAADEVLHTDIYNEQTRAISAETVLDEKIDNEVLRSTAKDVEHDEKIGQLIIDLENETIRAIDAENELDIKIENETSRATAAESAITDNLNDEILRSTNADTVHDLQISGLTDDIADLYATKQNNLIPGKYISIVNDVISADSNHVYRLTQAAYDALSEIDPEGLYIITDAPEIDLSWYTPLSAFTAEVLRSTTKDFQHDEAISGLTTGLTTEIQNRLQGDNLLQENLTNEVNRAISAETELHNEIINERDRAIAAESGITVNLNAEITRATNAENALDAKIDNEVTRSTAKDAQHDAEISGLTVSLQNEISRATGVENSLRNDLNSEIARALAAESAITVALDGEIQNRIDGDNALNVAKADKTSAVASANYDSANHTILLKNISGTVLSSIDASPFIIDGMVDDVRISGGNLVISFNTDAGKQDIVIPLTDIFNPANYYLKSETDALLATKVNVSDFNSYSASTKTDIDGKLATADFNAYSASTKTDIDSKLATSDFNSYSAATKTSINSKLSTADFNAYSAATKTDIDSKLAINDFNSYSGATADKIDDKLEIADFNSYSATTKSSIDSKLATSDFNTYSAATKNDIDGKLASADFNVYSASTNNIIDSISATVETLEDELGDDYYTKSETSGATEIANALANKQDTLVSTVNIKTINGESVLGSGNIHIESEVSGITSGECQQMIDASIATKQNILTAGTGISIVNDVISVTASSPSVDAYTKAESDAKFATITNFNAHSGDTTAHVTAAEKNTWNAKQNQLTAGTGININGTTISAKIWSGTQAQYDALAVKDNDTLYLIY